MRRSTAGLVSITVVAVALAFAATPSNPAGAESAKDDLSKKLFPFVLPWDDASPSITNLSGWLEKPAGSHGFIKVKDGHLYAGDKRIRFFGVNLVFGANFPKHEDAEKVDARMAKFGINCVRLQGLDELPPPSGLLRPDQRTLDPEQLDKLDYLIAQLKKNGIYLDLVLHAGRYYPGFPRWDEAPLYFKGIDLFFPAMIDAQRDYASALLGHVNVYTKIAYKDDPAFALIEINNEDGLIYQWSQGSLDILPDPYQAELRRLWNAWLGTTYANTGVLRRAWEDLPAHASQHALGSDVIGSEMLGNSWMVEQHAPAKANLQQDDQNPNSSHALRLTVQQPGLVGYAVQLYHPNLRFESGKAYRLRFRAKGDPPRRIVVAATQTHAPWRAMWTIQIPLGPEWEEFDLRFSPDQSESSGRITFSDLGLQAGVFLLADPSLARAPAIGLQEGEGVGTVSTLAKRDFTGRTLATRRAWIRFLWDTETVYWTEMRKFLATKLKARALIVGTQLTYSPFPIQADMDVLDDHAYWQHPSFPRKKWDPEDWTVQNVPMAGAPDGGTIPRLALGRVAGRPFICTEYNHPAPNTYSSEAYLLLAAYAALQDWDGIFAFDYSSRVDDWSTGRIANFFDIDEHSAKLATFPAAEALFLRSDVAPGEAPAFACARVEDMQDLVRTGASKLLADAFGLPALSSLEHPVGIKICDARASGMMPSVPSGALEDMRGQLRWDPGDGRGFGTIDTPRPKAACGFVTRRPYTLGALTITPVETIQGWAAIALTVIEGNDFRPPARILMTATGLAQNADMRWKDAAKSSVGKEWGKGPVSVEGVSASVSLSPEIASMTVWSLDVRGQRAREVPVARVQGHASFDVSADYHALQYEIDIR